MQMRLGSIGSRFEGNVLAGKPPKKEHLRETSHDRGTNYQTNNNGQ